jgi:hypothetical protein
MVLQAELVLSQGCISSSHINMREYCTAVRPNRTHGMCLCLGSRSETQAATRAGAGLDNRDGTRATK